MANKTVLVPVNPEGFGCGLLLGLIIHYWRAILIASLIIFGCIFGYGLLQFISEYSKKAILTSQIEVVNVTVRYDPNNVNRMTLSGASEKVGAFIADYDLLNKAAQAKNIQIEFQVTVTYRNCSTLMNGNEFTYTYGATEIITLQPSQEIQGSIIADHFTDGIRDLGGPQLYINQCPDYQIVNRSFLLSPPDQ